VESSAPVAAGTTPPPPTPKPAFDVGKFAGIFAAIGLALGAIGGILASLVSGILGLQFWQIPLAIIGLMLLISGPAMIVAWFKLKKRNLGPVLDANGWAINARARINIPFGTSLTKLARLPEGSRRSLADPFAEKKIVWPFYVLIAGVIVALIALWQMGVFSPPQNQ
jgi:MFS family permease